MLSFDLSPALDAYGHLWMAVLRQAIDDATIAPTTSEAQLERRRAHIWLKERGDYIGSLQWICDVLNIEARRIRSEFERRSSETGVRRRRQAVPQFVYHRRKS